MNPNSASSHGSQIANKTNVGIVIAVTLATLCLFNAVLPRLTNYYYWVKPASSMGWVVQMQDVVLHQIVPGKKNIVVIGDSRVSEGFSAALANQVSGRPDLNFIQAGMPGTTPRVWYYFLRKIDPNRRIFAAVVLMAQRYDDDNDTNDPTNNAHDLTFLQPLTDFRDALSVANSFTGLSERTHALSELLFPLMTTRDDLYDFALDPRARIADSKTWHGHFYEWLYGYDAPAAALPPLTLEQLKDFDTSSLDRPKALSAEIKAYVDWVVLKTPGVSPVHTAAYRTRWYGAIADTYSAVNVPTIIFQIPRGPYERYANRPVGQTNSLNDLSDRKKVILLDPRPFEALEKPQLFADDLHVNQAGRKTLTVYLTSLLTQQFPLSK